jgi:hypothetical protein
MTHRVFADLACLKMFGNRKIKWPRRKNWFRLETSPNLVNFQRIEVK